jgi:hypothetical protein
LVTKACHKCFICMKLVQSCGGNLHLRACLIHPPLCAVWNLM